MKIIPALTVVAILLAVQSADALTLKYEPSPGVTHRQVVYKKTTDKAGKPVELVMHIFEAKDRDKSKPAPAIVFFFGGGWSGGSPSQFFPHCDYLAGRGMVACAADYRVRTRQQTTPIQCVEDGKSAVRWLRANAKKMGIDPDKIAAGGGSAGGHVAASTGTLDEFDNPDEDSTVSSKPNAMCLFNPVIDTTQTGWGTKAASAATDGKPEKLSPTHNVKKGQPPTIIFHGTKDTTVKFENVERFAKLMKESGNRCELNSYDGQGHGFFNYGRSEGNKIYNDTIEKMDAFLVSLGWLGKN